MFSNRRQLRLWAARMLLVWLFGVASGVANACWAASLQPGGHHPLAPATQQAVQGDGATPECEFHAAPQASQEGAAADSQDPGVRSNCETYCDGFSVSISPLKSSLDNVPAHGLPQAAFAVPRPAPAASPLRLPAPHRGAGQAPPIRIAFLRLAL